MAEELDPLVHDFIEWIAKQPRSYADVLDAWRTSCPRLAVWEDASERGFVTRKADGATTTFVVTRSGREFLNRADG